MYYLQTEQSFDSAHFLSGYDGLCKNIHGHRWRVVIMIGSEILHEDRQMEGMVVDFSKLKKDLKEQTDCFDHGLIMKKDSLKPATQKALKEEGFRLITVEFRPTAEHFAKYFYEKMTEKGYDVKSSKVYETPGNCACYEKENHGGI